MLARSGQRQRKRGVRRRWGAVWSYYWGSRWWWSLLIRPGGRFGVEGDLGSVLTIDTFASADWKRKSISPPPDAARSTSDLPKSLLALLWPFLPWPRRPYVAVAIPSSVQPSSFIPTRTIRSAISSSVRAR